MAKTNSEKLQHQEDNLENVEHALTATEAFIEKYQKQIVVGILGVVIAVGAFMAYDRFHVQPLEKEAESQMFLGEQYFAKDSFQLAINGDGNFLGFEKIATGEYSSTPSGNLANYYVGISYMNLGKYEQAISSLKNFSTADLLISPVAAGAMGDCYMELEQYGKAVSAFKDAASYENEFTTSIYLKKLGVAYEVQGDFENAIDTYGKVKDAYPSSAEARDIEKYIARVSSKK